MSDWENVQMSFRGLSATVEQVYISHLADINMLYITLHVT